MQPGELAALLSALAVLIGTVWTATNSRRQQKHNDAESLWADAMQLIDRLREENETLKDEVWQLKHPNSRPQRRRRTVKPAE